MRMKQILPLLLAVVCALVLGSGCSNNSHAQSKAEALARWESIRAGTTLQLAQQQFDNGQLHRARQTLLEAIENQHNEPRLHILLAKVLFELQDLPAAQDQLDQARSLAPELAEVDYLQGILAQSAAQWPRAHQAYLAAYQKDPSSLPHLCALAEAKLALGQAQQAADLLSSRFGDFPSSAYLRTAAANSSLVMEDFDQAEQFYEQAIDIDPSNTEAQDGLANTFCLAGKYSQAIKILAKLVEQSPDKDPGWQRRLADCYLADSRYSLAITAYRVCLAENQDQPDLRLRMAKAWLLNGNAKKAQQELRTLLHKQSDNANVWELLGHSYLQNEQFTLAAQAYRQAIDKGADPAPLRLLLNFCTRQEQAYAPPRSSLPFIRRPIPKL